MINIGDINKPPVGTSPVKPESDALTAKKVAQTESVKPIDENKRDSAAQKNAEQKIKGQDDSASQKTKEDNDRNREADSESEKQKNKKGIKLEEATDSIYDEHGRQFKQHKIDIEV